VPSAASCIEPCAGPAGSGAAARRPRDESGPDEIAQVDRGAHAPRRTRPDLGGPVRRVPEPMPGGRSAGPRTRGPDGAAAGDGGGTGGGAGDRSVDPAERC